MKRKMAFLMVALFVLLLAACSNDSSSSDEPQEDIEVVSEIEGTVRVAVAGFQLEDGIDPITAIENKGLQTFVDEYFQPRYPNITIELTQVPWENAQAGQTAMLQSGDVDVLYTGGAFATQWYQQGLLRDLDDFIEEDEDFDPSIYLSGVWDTSYSVKSPDGEHQFGIPAILGRRVVSFDSELFNQWGVEPLSENPTPEEILEKAAQMTGENPETGEMNYGLWFDGASLNLSVFVALTHAFGATGGEGTLDDPANIEWDLNSPEMVEVFEWLEEAAQYPPSDFINTQGNENYGLESNNIGIFLDYDGATVMAEARADEGNDLTERFEARLNLGPEGEGWVAVDPYVMAANAQDEEAAWEVLKFFTSYEAQKFNYEQYTNTPTLTDPDFVSDSDIYMQKAAEIAEVATSTLMDEANPFFGSEMAPAVNGFVSEAHNGNAPDIQSYLDDLQERAERWSANQ
ncbi:ABC transporter substrate-binding protein [Gracilibacillus alcaliphilus]|uniref:ABC transporter substrate-binding protein n=1 Tax=Gracilibacillus alcaliphilus TaxID=1401441 RepID=UPI001958CC46|nr:extracellular solute-binding protein [Gracilibacillus alcaliphilus]MBM7677454.1 ABC-type glycerol-3-phosphate transport system substrate-binding protein [Gracilibacillus alcaliphilus]